MLSSPAASSPLLHSRWTDACRRALPAERAGRAGPSRADRRRRLPRCRQDHARQPPAPASGGEANRRDRQRFRFDRHRRRPAGRRCSTSGSGQIVSLPNGCVCCTIGSGLHDALAGLVGDRRSARPHRRRGEWSRRPGVCRGVGHRAAVRAGRDRGARRGRLGALDGQDRYVGGEVTPPTRRCRPDRRDEVRPVRAGGTRRARPMARRRHRWLTACGRRRRRRPAVGHPRGRARSVSTGNRVAIRRTRITPIGTSPGTGRVTPTCRRRRWRTSWPRCRPACFGSKGGSGSTAGRPSSSSVSVIARRCDRVNQDLATASVHSSPIGVRDLLDTDTLTHLAELHLH